MTTARTTSDGWTAAVRARLALGRLLPLGAGADGTWLAERAATAELRRAASAVPPGTVGPALGRLRLSSAGQDAAAQDVSGGPAVPPPPSALPPGPLRIDGEFAAGRDEPLPAVAARLRAVLFSCARDELGLVVTEVNLRATHVLDPAENPPGSLAQNPAGSPAGEQAEEPEASPQGPQALAAAAVAGVAYLTEVLGQAVHVTEDHVRVELATAAGHRPPDVSRAVRAAVAASVAGAPTVAVLITAVGRRRDDT
jgi:hypothetical protein